MLNTFVTIAGTNSLDLRSAAETGELPTAETSFGEYISAILSGVMALAALLVLVYFLWGAIEWITSGGDTSKVQKARDKITQAVIGMLVLSATLALFALLQEFLGIEVFRIGGRTGFLGLFP